MTPFEFVTMADLPASVQALALSTSPQIPLLVSSLPQYQSPLPPGKMQWAGPLTVDPTGVFATRTLRVEFGPPLCSQGPVTVGGVALVDQSDPPTILLTVPLDGDYLLSSCDATFTVEGPVAVVKQGA